MSDKELYLSTEGTPELKKFTAQELLTYDGSNGRPVYIAYQGKVYDVSASPLWKKGIHQGSHQAGREIATEIEAAPHSTEVFERFPLVGQLETEPKKGMVFTLWEKLLELTVQQHPHPILVHFPTALFITADLLLVLYLFLGDTSLESAAYYTLLVGTFFTPLTITAGFLSWWGGYQHFLTHIFLRKIQLSVVLFTICVTSSLWRTLVPGVMLEGSTSSWVYFSLTLLLSPTVILLGYYGAKITFPRGG